MMHENFYADRRLDRRAELRRDSAWIESLLARPATRIVPVWRSLSLVRGGEGEPAAVALSLDDAATLIEEARAEGRVFALLGLIDDVAHFLLDVSHLDEGPAQERLAGHGELVDMRKVGPLLPRHEGNLLAYARGLAHWHARHGFCGVCGHPTEIVEAGHVRRCTNAACGASHFPRTDPAVIMLVHDGDRCLLGHQARFADGMYSTLAGFVEPGESLEHAVAREVREEANIAVDVVRYHSSQPWPFPSSLMVGFHARATSTDIRLVDGELADVAWFTREDIERFPETGRRLPRPDSIARRLIEDWIAGRAGA